MKAPFSFIKSGSAPAFNPATDGTNLAEFYVKGNYALVSTTGTYTATAGNNAAVTSASAPTASGGVPLFDGSATAPLDNADHASVWISTGDMQQLAVIDFTAINTGSGAIYYQAGAWTDIENGVFILSFRKETGPVYWADFGIYKGGYSFCSIDISAHVNGSGAGRVTFQTKRDSGFVWMRVSSVMGGDTGWVQGDAISAGALAFQTNTLRLGTSYSSAFVLDGTIVAEGFYTSAQSDPTFSDLVPAWGAAL